MTQPRPDSLVIPGRWPDTPSVTADAPVSFEGAAALLRGLNREQRRAVTHLRGPQLVVAGPGTGKTEVVTRRVAWLIATKRALPREILALTFTDKAAAEMQARVDLLVPYGQADAEIHTFHAFGDGLLREHAFELGLAGDVRLLNTAELVVLLRDQLFSLGLERYLPLGDPTRFLAALVDFFGRAKDEDIGPADLAAHANDLRARAAVLPEAERVTLGDLAAARDELARAYERYVEVMSQRGVIDHGDQIRLALRLLRHRPAVAAAVRARFRHVLVDEFQDTNPAQLELVLALCGDRRNVTVVGDDAQAIYAFRGAASSNMRSFLSAHPDARRVVLRRNYRSRAPIIAASQRLIAHNEDHRRAAAAGLVAEPVAHRRRGRSAPVRRLAFATAADEADGVAGAIAERVEAGEPSTRFAVLVRSNREADEMRRALLARGLPVIAHVGENLYGRPEVRTLLAFLRVVADPSLTLELYSVATAEPYRLGGDELTALLATARRRHVPLWRLLSSTTPDPTSVAPLSAATRRRIARLVADVQAGIALSHERPAGEVLYQHLRRTGALSRYARVDAGSPEAAALANVARFFGIVRAQSRLLADERVAALVPHLATLAEASDEPADAGPDAVEGVNVLTVHRAKGLEFDIVYVCGLSEGRFPARGRPPALSIPDELRRDGVTVADPVAEERRLCYVAMTRARDELWLTSSLEAGRGRGAARPSRFLAEALDTGAAALVARGRLEPPSLPADPTAGAPSSAQQAASGRREPAALSLSFSQVDEYLACPERYRLRHVVGVPTPPHHALTYGSALHQAVAAFHARQASASPMTEEELLEAFARSWSPEGFLSREHEEARYAAGREALRRFRRDQLAPGSQTPAAIEQPFSFAIGRDTVRGRIDRLDDTPAGAVITDYKSSDVRDQRKADEKARASLQLQVYALAHQASTGRLPAAVQLHFLDSGVVGRATVDEDRAARARAKLAAAAEGIRGGDFRPRPDSVACGYCPYRDICDSSAA